MALGGLILGALGGAGEAGVAVGKQWMAEDAMTDSPSTPTATFFTILPHPLSTYSPKQQLHDHTDRKASQEKRPRPVH